MYWAIVIVGCSIVGGIVLSFLAGRSVKPEGRKRVRAMCVIVSSVLSILLALYFIIGTSILLMRRDDTTPSSILVASMMTGAALLFIWIPASAFLCGLKKNMH